MQTASSITNVSFSTDFVAPGIVSLFVSFQVHNNGPSHVAGLMVTTDFWATSHVAPAQFVGFGVGFENWTTTYQVPEATGGVNFEFAIFCDDFGGINAVPRIWNTNNGTRFQAHA